MNLPVDQLLTVLAVVRRYKLIAAEMFPAKSVAERDVMVRQLLYRV